jgi:hypothetical protein
MILAVVSIMVREHWNSLSSGQLAAFERPATRAFGDNAKQSDRLLFKWFLQGAVAPALFWCIQNLGALPGSAPYVPVIAVAQHSDKPWLIYWFGWSLKGSGFIALMWCAVTYAWMAFVIYREARAESAFRRVLVRIGAPMFVLAMVFLFYGKITDLPIALLMICVPIVHSSVSAVPKTAPVVSYGAAVAKIHRGKYEDAEIEVINQLEKHETDFQGWMMLAELYATKYQRFDDAAQVVVDLCGDPTVQEVEISVACNKLADWQLNLANNPPAARAALDLLIKALPGTHFAHMAKVRLRQLPRTREDLEDQKKHRPLRMPSLSEQDGKLAGSPGAAPAPLTEDAKREATLEANRLSDRLRDLPNEHKTRERLAILLAESLGQPALGIEQLRLIVKMNDVGGEQAAKNLAQIAAWERGLNKNEAKFRATLLEITRDFPGTTASLSARRQLQLIENESLAQPAPVARKPIRIKVPEA